MIQQYINQKTSAVKLSTQRYKAFLNGLPYISNTDRTYYCILMQTRNPLLQFGRDTNHTKETRRW